MKPLVSITALLVTLLLVVPAQAQTLRQKIASDDVQMAQDSDPAMQRAIALARQGLDGFLQTAKKPPKGSDGFAVKTGVRDGDSTEFFWVMDFTQKGDRVTGTLANSPRIVRNVRGGQSYSFSKSDIVDWMYTDAQGRMQGNLTMCALLTKEPAAEAAAIRKQYQITCPTLP